MRKDGSMALNAGFTYQRGTMEKIIGFFNFLFHTGPGVLVLILTFLVISIIVAFIMERKTRKTFVDRPPKHEEEDDDSWSFFDDEDD